ncbi:cupin domain-containing protein [Patulibacter sp. S7RM1-6]
MPEARIVDTPTGRLPADDGWWVLNLDEIAWKTSAGSGTWCAFESPEAPSRTLGIGVHVLAPGEASGRYHLEPAQEGFLVLAGECLAIVAGQERRLRTWDYLHCPPGTAHITVGAGDGPCALLMVGTRPTDPTHYPVNAVAARHGASVETATSDASEAYAGDPETVPASSPWAAVMGAVG